MQGFTAQFALAIKRVINVKFLEATSRVDARYKEVQKPEDTEGQQASCKP